MGGYEEKAWGILGGGSVNKPLFFPTVVATTSDNMLVRDEILGPVLSVIPVRSCDEAISVANDTAYGVCAALFTGNAKRARAARTCGGTPRWAMRIGRTMTSGPARPRRLGLAGAFPLREARSLC